MRPLAIVGRHATKFMAGGVLIGFFLPSLAALAKPLLVPTLRHNVGRSRWCASTGPPWPYGVADRGSWPRSSSTSWSFPRCSSGQITTPALASGLPARHARSADPDVGVVAHRCEHCDRTVRGPRCNARCSRHGLRDRAGSVHTAPAGARLAGHRARHQPAGLHGAARRTCRRCVSGGMARAAPGAAGHARGVARTDRRSRGREPRRLRDRHHGRGHGVCAAAARLRVARRRAGVSLQPSAAGRRVARVSRARRRHGAHGGAGLRQLQHGPRAGRAVGTCRGRGDDLLRAGATADVHAAGAAGATLPAGSRSCPGAGSREAARPR